MSIHKLFNVEIGKNEESGMFTANVISVTENKGKSIEGVSLKLVMSEVGKVVRKQTQRLRKFPLPEPSRIVPPQNGASLIIVPGRN